jgi:hypothetical protein
MSKLEMVVLAAAILFTAVVYGATRQAPLRASGPTLSIACADSGTPYAVRECMLTNGRS